MALTNQTTGSMTNIAVGDTIVSDATTNWFIAGPTNNAGNYPLTTAPGSSASALTYVIQAGAAGYRLWEGGSLIATGRNAPVNSTVPSISGTARVGQVLTANNGSWSGAPSSFVYQWFRNGSPISGATSQTYTLQAADEAHRICVRVGGTNANATGFAYSAATASVAPLLVPPVNTIAPAINGGPDYGDTLELTDGTWTGSGLVFTYAWFLDGVEVIGRTQNIFYLGDPSLAGKLLTAKVTATNGAGSLTVASMNGYLLPEPTPGTFNGTAVAFASGATTTAPNWSNPQNVSATDSATANYQNTNAKNPANSGVLTATIPFSTVDIPAGSTITGVTLTINRRASAANKVRDQELILTLNGYSSSSLIATPYWPTTNTDASYGGTGDVLGLDPQALDAAAGGATATVALTTNNGTSSTAYVDSISVVLSYSIEVEGGEEPEVPVNITAPVLSGIPNVGETISVTNGTWSVPPGGYSYMFYVCSDPLDIEGSMFASVPSDWISNTITVPEMGLDMVGQPISIVGGYLVGYVMANSEFGSGNALSNTLGPITATVTEPITLSGSATLANPTTAASAKLTVRASGTATTVQPTASGSVSAKARLSGAAIHEGPSASGEFTTAEPEVASFSGAAMLPGPTSDGQLFPTSRHQGSAELEGPQSSATAKIIAVAFGAALLASPMAAAASQQTAYLNGSVTLSGPTAEGQSTSVAQMSGGALLTLTGAGEVALGVTLSGSAMVDGLSSQGVVSAKEPVEFVGTSMLGDLLASGGVRHSARAHGEAELSGPTAKGVFRARAALSGAAGLGAANATGALALRMAFSNSPELGGPNVQGTLGLASRLTGQGVLDGLSAHGAFTAAEKVYITPTPGRIVGGSSQNRHVTGSQEARLIEGDPMVRVSDGSVEGRLVTGPAQSRTVNTVGEPRVVAGL